MKITKFEEFDCWKLSIEMAKVVYRITNEKDFSKDYGLRDQIRRSIVSVSANIVEGFERSNNNEFIRFLKIAKGSVGETRSHLYVAVAIGYIDKELFEKLNTSLIDLARQIANFINYLIQERNKNEFTKYQLVN